MDCYVIESGPASFPLYFCMEYRQGKPVWSFSFDDAKKFKNKEIAGAVMDEWEIRSISRVCEHGFE